MWTAVPNRRHRSQPSGSRSTVDSSLGVFRAVPGRRSRPRFMSMKHRQGSGTEKARCNTVRRRRRYWTGWSASIRAIAARVACTKLQKTGVMLPPRPARVFVSNIADRSGSMSRGARCCSSSAAPRTSSSRSRDHRSWSRSDRPGGIRPLPGTAPTFRPRCRLRAGRRPWSSRGRSAARSCHRPCRGAGSAGRSRCPRRGRGPGRSRCSTDSRAPRRISPCRVVAGSPNP